MNKRRKLLLSVVYGMLMPKIAMASSVLADKQSKQELGWANFQTQMKRLSEQTLSNALERQQLANSGRYLLEQLDINSLEFLSAVSSSYESGNRYWLWQRLIKQNKLNGGILNIDNNQMVQLHDHPGAIGMVRIISGEAEVWQFDEAAPFKTELAQGITQLNLLKHKILRVGDTAVLTPDSGNIHALRSITKECRMLDFFIPPYKLSQRSWFEPLSNNWFEKKQISCRKIPHNAYTNAQS